MYSQPDYYSKKWGISWFYRWIADANERRRVIQTEPSMKDINDRYEAMIQKKVK